MPSTSTRFMSSIVRSLPTAVLVAGLALACTDSALASCGDWLEGHDAAQPAAPAEAAQAESESRGPVPAERPCRGASCRAVPSVPLAPTNTSVTAEHDRDAVLPAGVDAGPRECGTGLPADAPPTCATFSKRHERPPRHG